MDDLAGIVQGKWTIVAHRGPRETGHYDRWLWVYPQDLVEAAQAAGAVLVATRRSPVDGSQQLVAMRAKPPEPPRPKFAPRIWA